MTLYLKYRPKNLDEIDLPQVATSLKKIISGGSVPHAFLFSGPKGTGKTSAARILAKVLNCEHPGKAGEPCGECEQCTSITKGSNLDVIEMDAASHRGIDDVRTLRDAVKLSPVNSKKKIYIIDEAHMLTTEASNALLKTLEEPPEHVVFILATTNPEKLIDTIRSRTTLVQFRKAGKDEIINALKRVVDGEKIKISPVGLAQIAEASGGAFRDAIKILEQYSLEGESYLESLGAGDLSVFITNVIKKDEKSAIEEVERLVNSGVAAESIINNMLTKIHQTLLYLNGIGEKGLEGLNKIELVELSGLLSDALRISQDVPIEQLSLEMAIVKWCGGQKTIEANTLKSNDPVDKPQEDAPPKKAESAPAEEQIKVTEVINVSVQNENPPIEQVSDFNVNATVAEISIQGTVDDNIWKNILTAVRPVNASIEGLLRSSRPMAYDGKTLTLGVFYKFHKERLEDAKHRKILEDIMAHVLNTPTRIVCTLVEPPAKKVVEVARHEPILTETREPDIIKAAEEIFGA